MRAAFFILCLLAVAGGTRLVGQWSETVQAERARAQASADHLRHASTDSVQSGSVSPADSPAENSASTALVSIPSQETASGGTADAAPNSAARPDTDFPARVDALSDAPANRANAPAGNSQDDGLSSDSVELPSESLQLNPSIRHQARFHDQMITPGNFEYLGAFRPPHAESAQQSFAYGGSALAFRADGDPTGDADGYPGSLYIVGHSEHQRVAEIAIPQPTLPKLPTLDDLPVAHVLQSFHDITGGILEQMNSESATPFRIGGLQVVDQRLHWTMHKYYNVDGRDFPSHGAASLDLMTGLAEGPWHLGPMNSGRPEWHSYKHAGYIFEIPEQESDTWFDGANLISGLQISTGLQFSSQGPAMYAYRLPEKGTPASASVNAIPLVWYSEQVPLAQHHPADRWTGGAWLTLGPKQAVVIVGRKALGEVYYGEARPHDCTGDKGYHGTPYEVQLMFYSPASLIHVAHGRLKAHALQPWLRWSGEFDGGGISQYLYPTCGQDVGGFAYDREHNLLYLVQLSAGLTSDNEYEPLPVIHVFRITASRPLPR